MKRYGNGLQWLQTRRRNAPAVAWLFLGGCALGAAAMYALDPVGGARRRAFLRDKGVHLRNVLADTLDKRGRDLRQRARGRAIEARKRLMHERVPDETLVERVRSAIGRHVTASRVIGVVAEQGCVTLRGPVLAHEVPGLLAAARRVRGVREVRNALEVHERADIPALAGAVAQALVR